jgi:hypothetical protein
VSATFFHPPIPASNSPVINSEDFASPFAAPVQDAASASLDRKLMRLCQEVGVCYSPGIGPGRADRIRCKASDPIESSTRPMTLSISPSDATVWIGSRYKFDLFRG